MTVIMEGYDVTLLGSFYGYPMFRTKYGEWLNEDSGYQISSTWQQRFNCLAAVANIVGALMNGWATARWGHRKVLIASLAWLSAFIFVVFFAPTIEILLVGQTLCNIPWGVFATTGPSYAAEVTPLAIRGYLTGEKERPEWMTASIVMLTSLVSIHQPVLGDRTVPQRSDSERARGQSDAMGLSNPVCVAGMELRTTLPASKVSVDRCNATLLTDRH
jgi:MFS family permease